MLMDNKLKMTGTRIGCGRSWRFAFFKEPTTGTLVYLRSDLRKREPWWDECSDLMVQVLLVKHHLRLLRLHLRLLRHRHRLQLHKRKHELLSSMTQVSMRDS